MKRQELYVFICEDHDLARRFMNEFFDQKHLTYVSIFPVEKRKQIVETLNKLEELPPPLSTNH